MARKKRNLPTLRKRMRTSVLRLLEACPVGTADASVFEARCASWNYASVGRNVSGLAAIAELPRFFASRTEQVGCRSIVGIGTTHEKEIDVIDKITTEAAYVALSPQILWNLGFRLGMEERSMCVPANMLGCFSGAFNGAVFHRTLHLMPNPEEWIESAKEVAKAWIYVSLDTISTRKMKSTEAVWLRQHFQGWQTWLYDFAKMEYVTADSDDGVLAAMGTHPTFLFLRR